MYNGSSLVGIDDANTRIVNGNFKPSSGKYLYVRMEPVVISVDITWGAYEYDCEKVWDPSTHTYYDVWTVDDGADEVKVTNVGSNIPVKTTVSHYIDESTGITASFVDNRNVADINTTVVEKLDTTTNLFGGSNAGVLSKYFVLSGLPNGVYNNETVGNVTVRLESVCN